MKVFKNLNITKKLAILCLVILFIPGCTTKEKREPGPVVVHFIDDPESRVVIGLLTDQFIKFYKIPVEIKFVDEMDLRFNILEDTDKLEETVDIVELDLYYLEDAQKKMTDLSNVVNDRNASGRYYHGPLEAGKFDEEYKFIPFRLSWPLMMVSKDYRRKIVNFSNLSRMSSDDLKTVVFPSLKEREFFQIVFAIIKEYEGDPENLDDPNLYEAFRFMAELGPRINTISKVNSAGDSLNYSSYDMPMVFFEWPTATIELAIRGTIPKEISALPLPSLEGKNGGTFAFGRYLGILKNARHNEDSIKYIQFMTSGPSQSKLLYGSPWLPTKNNGWGKISTARREAYVAYISSGSVLIPPPRKLKKVESAITSAAWQVMYEGKDPKDALRESKNLMKE